MRIGVIGAGAIGALVAAYLTDKGEDVVLIARPQQAEVINQQGLAVSGVRGDLTVALPVKAQLDREDDLVIIATKTQDLGQALSDNQEFLKNARLLTTQNGLRAEELVMDRFPGATVFSSIVMFGSTYLGPGKILHNFEGPWIIGSVHSEGNGSPEHILPVLSKAFPCKESEDLRAMKWLKLFLNANNCLPAILGKSMQETFRSIDICKVSLEIWREGRELIAQAGITLKDLPDFPAERIDKLISMPIDAAAGVFSQIMTNLSKEPLYGSILQSIKRGRPSEIDYINGEFVKLAQSLGAKAPLNERLVQMVHVVERNNQFFDEEQFSRFTKELVDHHG